MSAHTTLAPVGDDVAQLTERAHAVLREAIVSGQLAPGARLVQEQVASELRISRTPVREALHLLEREGLVQLIPRRGAVVVALTADDARDLYELRELLEPYAAARAATLADQAQRRELSLLAERTDASDEPAQAFARNRAFHEALCRPCGNQMLLRALDAVWTQGGSHRLFSFQAEHAGALVRMRDEHVAIARAFARADAEEVARSLSEHIRSALTDTLARLADEAGPATRGDDD